LNCNLLCASSTALALLMSPLATSAAEVGVSVSVGQPGFYGRIDIGDVPPPRLIYPQPLVIAPAPVTLVQQPIYLRVPPGHAKDWKRYCSRYSACGQSTYFVQEDWYRRVYAPSHGYRYDQVQHRRGYDERQGPEPREERRGRGYDHGHDRGQDHDRGHEQGHGKGHGRGNGNGKGHGRD
jgi:hypothetical protein